MAGPADPWQRERLGSSTDDMPVLLRRGGCRFTGRATAQFQLTGRWWAAWQAWTQGDEIVATQPIEMDQHGATVRVRALERSQENVRGGYLWAGELRIWDNRVLMGWYAAEDQNVRSRGTFFFQLHGGGGFMEGRWTGMSYDGTIISGWAAISRVRDESVSIIERLKSQGASEPA